MHVYILYIDRVQRCEDSVGVELRYIIIIVIVVVVIMHVYILYIHLYSAVRILLV